MGIDHDNLKTSMSTYGQKPLYAIKNYKTDYISLAGALI